MKGKKFSSGIRPKIELRTLFLHNREVAVLTIKNSTDTPYFLLEEIKDNGRVVRPHHIYTRAGDSNTDIDKSADINHVEYLWKKRFLLTRSPFEQFLTKLRNKDEWKRDEYTYFNIYNPEFTITIEHDEEDLTPEFYSYALTNESTMFRMLNVNYFGTKLYSRQKVVLDGGRYSTPVPDWGFLCFSKYKTSSDYAFKYFIKEDPAYILNQFLYDESDSEERYARQRFFEVVLLFENDIEKDLFMQYAQANQTDFKLKLNALEKKYSVIASDSKRKDDLIDVRLRTGKALNQTLLDFRRERLEL
ncbi:MAG: ATP-binding protein [Dethiobacter sp.]|nr:ATP-binding protein [Dethiobacter sp.]